VSGFPFPRNENPFLSIYLKVQFRISRNPELVEAQVLAFLGTANPLGFLAPDLPKPGNPNLTPLLKR
jgi:hypothetical protein